MRNIGHVEESVHQVYSDAEDRRLKAMKNLSKIATLNAHKESLQRGNWLQNIEEIKRIETEMGMYLFEIDMAQEEAASIRKKMPSYTVEHVETPIQKSHHGELESQIEDILRVLPGSFRSILNTPGIHTIASKILEGKFSIQKILTITFDEWLNLSEVERTIYDAIKKMVFEEHIHLTQGDVENFYEALKLSVMANDVNALLEA
jgi:hypothetical protein